MSTHHFSLVDISWRGRKRITCKNPNTGPDEVLPMLAEVDEHVDGAVQGGQEVGGVGRVL